MRKERNMRVHCFLCLFSVFLFTLMAMGSLQENSTLNATNNIAKPWCPTKCGNVTIPYPFGIGNDTGCALDDSFYVTCNETSQKLFLGSGNIDIFNISESELRIWPSVAYKCYNEDGSVFDESDGWTNLVTFTFSDKNKFIVIGCDDYGLFSGEDGGEFSSGCIGLCSEEAAGVVDEQCSGNGCCQTSITKGLSFTNYTLNSFRNHSSVWSINYCGYAFLAEEGSFQFRGKDDISGRAFDVWNRITSTVPVVVDWVIAPDQNCSDTTYCKENSACDNIDGGGYRCRCKDGYEGNPYLDQGCQDIDECKSNTSCHGHICINSEGSYNCTCSRGYKGDAHKQDGCQPIVKGAKFPVTIFTLALVIVLVALLSAASGTLFGIRKRRLIKLREKFFEQNGGTFLKQKLKAPGTSDAVIIYSTEELRKATDNHSKERIIGQGGYGVVYKGILSDNREVAIKKSKLVDGTQAEQFINEVLILTQVIHRNVVKVLGCCLEEEVPVLVYEFISNNTLFYHIHHKLGGMSWLSWENRLRVAAEAAGALAYLHSQATMPIIHRDVKSSNILLDVNYTTKISDFGASRLVPLDHDQVTTLVQGTLGYLDPEYFNTSQLTDKSDVYSFGVVLAELITGQKPLSTNRTNEEKNLATYFVKAIKENRLLEIVEPRLLREGILEQLQEVGDLVKGCLHLHGNDRPTMKEVAIELEGLKKFKITHPWDKQQTQEESTSLTLEVEQSDLYDVPLIPYTNGEWDSNLYSISSTSMSIQENKPR